MAMPRDPVVHPIPDESRDYPPRSQEPPGKAEITGQSEHGVGADQHLFGSLRIPLDPSHRINTL
jgi:hypothetical protein